MAHALSGTGIQHENRLILRWLYVARGKETHHTTTTTVYSPAPHKQTLGGIFAKKSKNKTVQQKWGGFFFVFAFGWWLTWFLSTSDHATTITKKLLWTDNADFVWSTSLEWLRTVVPNTIMSKNNKDKHNYHHHHPPHSSPQQNVNVSYDFVLSCLNWLWNINNNKHLFYNPNSLALTQQTPTIHFVEESKKQMRWRLFLFIYNGAQRTISMPAKNESVKEGAAECDENVNKTLRFHLLFIFKYVQQTDNQSMG